MNVDPHSAIPRGMIRAHDPTAGPSYVRGTGVWLWDSDGKDYVDLTSSYSSLNFGHSHPELTAIAKEQLETLVHLTGAPTPWRLELCQQLADRAPFMEQTKTWICTTGARAIEVAWKIAYARKPGMLFSFDQGFHGRSIATSLLSQTARTTLLEQESQTIARRSLTFPQCTSCPFDEQPESCSVACFESIEQQLREHASRISAVIIEPAIGARGYLFAPKRFFHRLRKLTRELDILLIADEIQSGLGRLGSLFASIEQGWQPDLIVIGKSLGGGLVPISAVLGPGHLMDLLDPGIESETFAGDPLGCRIGLRVLEMLDDQLLTRAREIGEILRQRLRHVIDPRVAQILGEGCCGVIEFRMSPRVQGSSKQFERESQLAEQFARAALHCGILVHRTGPLQNRIVLLPPLTITDAEIDIAIDRLKQAWTATC